MYIIVIFSLLSCAIQSHTIQSVNCFGLINLPTETEVYTTVNTTTHALRSISMRTDLTPKRTRIGEMNLSAMSSLT